MNIFVRIAVNLAALVAVGVAAWFLTGLDHTHSGESTRGHYVSRALRTAVLVCCSLILLWILQTPLNYFDKPLLILSVMGLAYTLRSVIADLLSQVFMKLIDPAGAPERAIDPAEARQYEREISRLIHSGQRAEAIQLCEQLKRDGGMDRMTLEHTLEYLGVKQTQEAAPPPLVAAARLREQGQFAEAEQQLKTLLRKNPADEGAGIMLMRLYVQDLRQPEQAEAVWQALAKQPRVSAAHLEFARRSFDEWSQTPPPVPERDPLQPPPLPPTLEELLAGSRLGEAVEMIEEQIRAQPQDFALRLQLAEVYAVHCKNLQLAEKIVQQLEFAPGVTPEQFARARVKLAEWRAAKLGLRAV